MRTPPWPGAVVFEGNISQTLHLKPKEWVNPKQVTLISQLRYLSSYQVNCSCVCSFLLSYFRESTPFNHLNGLGAHQRSHNRHATTGPSGIHWNKVCSSHSYSLNHIWTGDTSIYVNEVVPHSSAGIQAWGDSSSLYVFQARMGHLCHLIWTPTRRDRNTHWMLLPSAQQLRVKQEHVTFTQICKKCTGTLNVSTRDEYGTGSFLTQFVATSLYENIY